MRSAVLRIKQGLASPQFAIATGMLTCAVIAIYIVWYSSAGKFPDFPETDNAYVELGESFLHGQLFLLEEPNPQLKALPNPYDPTQRNAPHRWDASYYKGNYYLYWGPVPALAFAVVQGITSIRPAGSLLVIVCYMVLPIILLMILFQIRRQFFPASPVHSMGLCLLISFINLPFLFLLGRPIIYETSIIAGQFFLFLGLLGWVMYGANSAKVGWLIVAGLSWGLAIGSRYNLVISTSVYMAFILTQIAQDTDNRQTLKKIALLLTPLLLCLIGLGFYNYVRFGSPFETGLTYQLSLPEIQSEPYSTSYVLSNLFIYLFYPMTTSENFPFILSTLPAGNQFDEVTAGLFSSTPSTWLLVLVAPIIFIAGKTSRADALAITSLKRLLFMLLSAVAAQSLFLMVFFFDAMRYMADFYLQLTLAMWILVWMVGTFIRPIRPLHVIYWLIISGFVIWTAGIGFFGGFDIPPQSFRTTNPVLYMQLESFWNNLFPGTGCLLTPSLS